MKWESPFAHTFCGEMKDTETFPSFRVLNNGVPARINYSYGIDLTAAIAIILRDIIGTENDGTRFNKIFRCDFYGNQGFHGEAHLLFSKGIFPRLHKRVNWVPFVFAPKSRVFRLFDRIAEFQHVTVPKHQNTNHLVDHCHESLKCELQQFVWPKMPILSNTGRYSVTSQKDVLSHVERNSVTLQDDPWVNAEESSVTLHTTEF
jgi:hypothetical protein